ncbi:MAG: GNAT family N-acetyltransferase [Fusobacteriaceae bacterium]
MIEINGELINLRTVELNDAEFILSLRKDESLNKFISSTSSSLSNQKEWIQKYFERENQKIEYYFMIRTKSSKACGTVRLYKIDNLKKECTWGSFMLNSDRPNGASYETISLSLNYAFNKLNLEKVFLDVRKENKKAIHIYEKAGFKKISEDNENYYYIIEKRS